MFKEERDSSRFSWEDLGDLETARPNLGMLMPVAVYRLLQYTMRDVLICEYDVKKADDLFIKAGRLAGEHAATGKSSPMAAVYGTSIVRVFNRTAALTGLTVKMARALGRAARSVTVVASHHAGYYPGELSLPGPGQRHQLLPNKVHTSLASSCKSG